MRSSLMLLRLLRLLGLQTLALWCLLPLHGERRARHSWPLLILRLEVGGRPDPPAESPRQRVERGCERPLRPRRGAVGRTRCDELRTATRWPAALPSGQPIAVVTVRRERGMDRLLQEVRRPQRLLGV